MSGFYFILNPELSLFLFRNGFHIGLPAGTPVDMPAPETTQERFGISIIFSPPGTSITFGVCHAASFLLLMRMRI
jgi:hypothetical protein